MLTRRDWLKSIIAVPIAAAVGAKLLPAEAPTVLRDPQLGIAIRFVQQYVNAADQRPSRLDVWVARRFYERYRAEVWPATLREDLAFAGDRWPEEMRKHFDERNRPTRDDMLYGLPAIYIERTEPWQGDLSDARGLLIIEDMPLAEYRKRFA